MAPFVDIHSHVLPGIDDGAKSAEEAIQMLEMAASDGIGRIITTPHLYVEAYKHNTPEAVSDCYYTFQQLVSERPQSDSGVTLPELFIGSENFVNDKLILDLENKSRLVTLNNSNYILLEFSLSSTFTFFDRLMNALFIRGLTAVIAHPERNVQFQMNPQILHKLVSKGAYLQLDSMSLVGSFGPDAKKMAFYLLERNLAHFMATDAHGTRNRKPLVSEAVQIASKIIGKERARALATTNPACILSGTELPVREIAESAPKGRSWLQSLIR